MKKIFKIALMSVTAMALLVGCGSKDANSNSGASGDANVSTQPTADVNSDTITVKHSKGETIVPIGAKKAVVFDMSILDTIDTLNIEVELAVPTGSVPAYLSKYETAVNAGGIKEPDMEAIYTFKPDVIFISGRQSDYYEELNKIAPTVYVDLESATYLEDVKRNVSYVAQIFGKVTEAEAKLVELEEKIASVSELASNKEEKALIILTNNGSLSAYGKGSRFGLIHDTLNVKTADDTIEASTHGQEASYEYIAEVNPDILYVVDRTSVAGGTVDSQETLNNDLVNSTNAAKNEKIVFLDPECWYLSGGGLTSVNVMVDEIKASLE